MGTSRRSRQVGRRRARLPVLAAMLACVAGLVGMLGLVAACGSGGAGTSRSAGRSAAVGATATHPPAVGAVARTLPMRTHVVEFVTAGGAVAGPVAATLRGSCFTGSIAAAGSDAYRCLAGNRLLDPCVAPAPVARASFVVCRADPWSSATRIELTTAPPRLPAPVVPQRPWAIELAGGQRCVAVTGTVSRSHGVALSYSCRGGGAASSPRQGSDGGRTSAYLGADGRFAPAVAVVDAWIV